MRLKYNILLFIFLVNNAFGLETKTLHSQSLRAVAKIFKKSSEKEGEQLLDKLPIELHEKVKLLSKANGNFDGALLLTKLNNKDLAANKKDLRTEEFLTNCGADDDLVNRVYGALKEYKFNINEYYSRIIDSEKQCKKIKMLLDLGVDINTLDATFKESLLIIAARNRQVLLIEQMIEYHPNFNWRNLIGNNSYMDNMSTLINIYEHPNNYLHLTYEELEEFLDKRLKIHDLLSKYTTDMEAKNHDGKSAQDLLEELKISQQNLPSREQFEEMKLQDQDFELSLSLDGLAI